jgi:hypothetical protein
MMPRDLESNMRASRIQLKAIKLLIEETSLIGGGVNNLPESSSIGQEPCSVEEIRKLFKSMVNYFTKVKQG